MVSLRVEILSCKTGFMRTGSNITTVQLIPVGVWRPAAREKYQQQKSNQLQATTSRTLDEALTGSTAFVAVRRDTEAAFTEAFQEIRPSAQCKARPAVGTCKNKVQVRLGFGEERLFSLAIR